MRTSEENFTSDIFFYRDNDGELKQGKRWSYESSNALYDVSTYEHASVFTINYEERPIHPYHRCIVKFYELSKSREAQIALHS